MGKDTKIGWTDHTWNPWMGCTKVAEGCRSCYAAADMDDRRGRVKWGKNGTRVLTGDTYWKQPIAWNKAAELAGERRRVFCASLADVFEDWQGPIERNRWIRPRLEPAYLERRQVWIAPSEPDRYVEWQDNLPPEDQANIDAGLFRPATMADVRASLFRLIDRTPWLDWLLLTKRPENIRKFWTDRVGTDGCELERPSVPGAFGPSGKYVSQFNGQTQDYRANCWLGTSVSEQETVDRNVPLLLQCHDLSPVRFLSMEPLLGPVDFRQRCFADGCSGECGWPSRFDLLGDNESRSGAFIDWVILGAESGPGRRPCDLNWAHDLNAQLKAARVPVFNKQYVINDQLVTDAGRFPLALRAQDFPVVPT